MSGPTDVTGVAGARSAEAAADVESLLASMVRIDTVNAAVSGRAEAERPLAEHLERCAAAYGLASRRLPVAGCGFNLLLSHEVSADAGWLLFESHLDTVGVAGMEDPFTPRIEAGRMWGRGSCDTKGSGAAMLWALRRYAAEGGGAGNVGLLLSVDEEIGKRGINAFVASQLPGLGWRPAAAVVGEPTGLRCVTAHKGVVRWTITAEGLAAHSSDPSRGRSAISAIVEVVRAIEQRYVPSLDARHPLVGSAVCSVNLIAGGSQINVIPDRAEIQIDRRTVPGERGEDVRPAVEALLEELRRRRPEFRISQGEAMVDPPLDPAGSVWWAAAVGEVLAERGLDPEPVGVGYGTDASTLGAAGIPSVVLGPGDIAVAHTTREHLELAELHRAVEVYLGLMRRGPRSEVRGAE